MSIFFNNFIGNILDMISSMIKSNFRIRLFNKKFFYLLNFLILYFSIVSDRLCIRMSRINFLKHDYLLKELFMKLIR